MILLVWLLSRSGVLQARLVQALAAALLAIAPAQIIAVLRAHPPGEWYFGLPPLTLPLGLRNPTPIESVGPGAYARPEMVASVVEDLESRPVLLIVLRTDTSIRRRQHYTVD